MLLRYPGFFCQSRVILLLVQYIKQTAGNLFHPILSNVSSNFNLSSKTVLITGGAGFLGSHFATSLLQNDCTVVISDLCLDSLAFAKDKLNHLYPECRLHTVV